MELNSIQEIISDISEGKMVVLMDDEDRENEGDFLAAAEKITPQTINFMAKHGRGLICAPITEKRCEKLKLKKMVDDENSDPMETAFTVSVDLKGSGITTGISASDRSKTIRALVDSKIQARNLTRPGHVFPLIAKEGGVLRRTGHTEAAIDFARLAGFKPAGVISEIMNDDGSMARLPELIKVAEKFDLKIVSIEDLVAYRMKHDSLIKKKFESEIETKFGKFDLTAYEQTTNSQIHISLTKGNWSKNDSVLTRIHSSRISNDILTMLINKESKGVNKIFELINKEGIGAIIFINQIEPFKDLVPRIKKLKKMQLKKHKVQTPPLFMDTRDFGIGAQILHDLNINKLRIISNSSKKPRVGLTGYGLEIVEYIKY